MEENIFKIKETVYVRGKMYCSLLLILEKSGRLILYRVGVKC